ncbi:MAG: aminotransferase class IV [Burkholderiaceae bacterium]
MPPRLTPFLSRLLVDEDRIVYLNGRFLPLAQAQVSVLDRGFLFGDGVYEVVPAYARRPFRWPQHLARLRRSLARLRIELPLDDRALGSIVTDLIERHTGSDLFVYMQITRGVAPRDHAFPNPPVAPTVFAMCNPFTVPARELVEGGIEAITLPDERWLNCDIKSISLLGNVLARQAAADQQAREAILFRDGFLTEASASNVWLARQGQVLGPHKDRRMLEGIRVGLVESLCAQAGLTLDQRNITRDEVLEADEIMVTSATKEILAVVRLDGKPVGKGRPGPVFKALWQAYQQAKREAAQS